MIKGFLEAIRPYQVRGWAFDPERPDERLTVRLLDSDQQLGLTSADMFREDLMKLWNTDGRHGYIINLDRRIPDLQSSGIVVAAVAPSGETTVLPRVRGIKIGETTIPDPTARSSRGTVEGFFSVTDKAVTGWAIDRADPDHHLTIEVLLGEASLAQTVASTLRQDLIKAKIGKGDHAFEVACAETFTIEQAQRIKVVATGQNGAAGILTYRPNLRSSAYRDAPNARFPGSISDPEQRPVFVLGAARSGTSAMGQAISRSSAYSGHGEGHLLDLIGVLMRATNQFFEQRSASANTLCSVTPMQFFEGGIRNVFVEFARINFPSKRWLDKTPRPEMTACAAMLREVWPNSKFIFMKRRGLENLASRSRKFLSGSFEGHCQDWSNAMRAWVQVRNALVGVSMEVDQLHMALHPQQVADEVAGFLELNGTERLKLGQSLSLEQPERTSDQIASTLDLQTVDWTDEQKETFLRVCGPVLMEFGYSTDASYFLPGWEAVALQRH